MGSQDVTASVTRFQRLYFVAIGLFALWVGVWGYFIPQMVDEAIPWLVPPMHARFLGAVYFSGMAVMIGCLLAKRWADISVMVVIAVVWTGVLGIVSMFYLPEFNFRREQVWFWFAAYIAYPIIGAWFLWSNRDVPDEAGGAPLPLVTRTLLIAQGVILTLLGLGLLIAPQSMVKAWPWPVTALLAHIYSAPFLAYGISSILMSRREEWAHIQIGLVGIVVLAALTLLASFIHQNLFSGAEISDVLWFAVFSLLLLSNGAMTITSFAKTRA